MPRMTIYLDDDTKSRMDAFTAEVNWSQIAQEAFVCHIKKADSGNGEEKMGILARIKKTVVDDVQNASDNGEALGFQIAENSMSYWQLEYVASFFDAKQKRVEAPNNKNENKKMPEYMKQAEAMYGRRFEHAEELWANRAADSVISGAIGQQGDTSWSKSYQNAKSLLKIGMHMKAFDEGFVRGVWKAYQPVREAANAAIKGVVS